jgi:hypothetical protein
MAPRRKKLGVNGLLARCQKAGQAFADTPYWESIKEEETPDAIQWYWIMVARSCRGEVWLPYRTWKAIRDRLAGINKKTQCVKTRR